MLSSHMIRHLVVFSSCIFSDAPLPPGPASWAVAPITFFDHLQPNEPLEMPHCQNAQGLFIETLAGETDFNFSFLGFRGNGRQFLAPFNFPQRLFSHWFLSKPLL